MIAPRVAVRRDEHFETVAPHPLGELHSYLMRSGGVHLARRERLIRVKTRPAFALVSSGHPRPVPLRLKELIRRNVRTAVYPRDIAVFC